MKLSLSKSSYNFYESFSDLLFCTLVLFVVLVLALALNVNKKVKGYHEELKQDASAEIAKLKAEVYAITERAERAEKRAVEAERARAAAEKEPDVVGRAERAEKAAKELAQSLAASSAQIAKAEEKLKEKDRLLSSAVAELKKAEIKLAELQKQGLSSKKYRPACLFFEVARGDTVLIGGKSFTPQQLVTIIKSLEGDLLVDTSKCPATFRRKYLPFLGPAELDDEIDLDALRRRHYEKWR